MLLGYQEDMLIYEKYLLPPSIGTNNHMGIGEPIKAFWACCFRPVYFSFS